MSFTPQQITALDAKLDGSHVKTRKQGGSNVSYIEGWQTIAEANRIFGFDGWTRETLLAECVYSGDYQKAVWENGRKTDKTMTMFRCTYNARVRVTAGGVFRDGTGSGHGFGENPGDAHESAIKEAETDAMKRALMTFGNPFGLALYDKAQSDVDRGGNGTAPPTPAPGTNGTKAPPPDLKALAEKIIKGINAAPHIDGLDSMMDVTMKDRQSLPAVTQAHISRVYMAKREALVSRS